MINNTRQLVIFIALYFVVMMAAAGAALIIGEAETTTQMPLIVSEIPTDIEQEVIRELIQYFNPRLPKEKQLTMSRLILDKAEKFRFEPFLVAGIIATESSFRPGVVSPCKARGLMQITDKVSLMMNVENPYDIEQNINAGIKYLELLRQRFSKDELILAAYNAGPTRVARLQRIPRIRETMRYVKRVIRLRKKLDNMFQVKLRQSFEAVSVGLIAWGGHDTRQPGGSFSASRAETQDNPVDCDGPRRLLVIQA